MPAASACVMESKEMRSEVEHTNLSDVRKTVNSVSETSCNKWNVSSSNSVGSSLIGGNGTAVLQR